jgi:hypothetical protein
VDKTGTSTDGTVTDVDKTGTSTDGTVDRCG